MIAVLMAPSGCASCELALTYAVVVEVEDEDGTRIPDAIVEYSWEGGAFTPCEEQPVLGGGQWVCGGGKGITVVNIEWQGLSDSMEFDIEGDQCSLTTQEHTFVL